MSSGTAGRRGFTLIELVVTVVILAVLASTAAVAYNQFAHQSNETAAAASAAAIRDAVVTRAMAGGQTPSDTVAKLWSEASSPADFLKTLGVDYAGKLEFVPADGQDPASLQVGGDDAERHPVGITLPDIVGAPAPLVGAYGPSTPMLAAGQPAVDSFDGTGDIAGSSVGGTPFTWSAPAGQWSRNSGAATTNVSYSASPMATTDLGVSDVTVTLDTYSGFGGSDALYFRVVDDNNWFRLRQWNDRDTYSYQSGWWAGGWRHAGGWYSGSYSWGVYGGRVHGYYVHKTTCSWLPEQDRYWVNRYTRNVYADWDTGVSYRRYVTLEQATDGALASLQTWSVGSFGTLKVTANGNQITVFNPNSSTALGTVTDDDYVDATKFGFGLASGTTYSTGSDITKFTADAVE